MQAKEYNASAYNVLVMKPGNRLRALRKAAGMTQGDLGDLTGVSQPAISQIENGVLSMDINWMRAFARALGCKPADLLDDDDNPDRLDPAEKMLLEQYRSADQSQRRTLERIAAAVVSDSDDTSTPQVA